MNRRGALRLLLGLGLVVALGFAGFYVWLNVPVDRNASHGALPASQPTGDMPSFEAPPAAAEPTGLVPAPTAPAAAQPTVMEMQATDR